MSFSCSPPGGSNTGNLLECLQSSLPDAWLRLNSIYGPIVYRWCRNGGVREADAPDVVQEVFGSVLTSILRFRKEKPEDSFRAWVRTITKNKIVDYFRAERKRTQAVGGSEIRDTLEQQAFVAPNVEVGQDGADDDGLTERVLALIQSDFDERTWRAFWKSAVDESSVASIAIDLGMTQGAVRQAKYRVLRRLREELSEWE
ncbi:MAG: sigma-70 family RNA polymerase sigma factor [Planctomycetales bacterium]|nr:sigma-70 family RNA polymerase sigma factor [Planctomycetales bacterium]